MLGGGLGHSDLSSQPGTTLNPFLHPYLILRTKSVLGQNPQLVLAVAAIHVISELDAYLRAAAYDGGAEQASFLPVGNVVTLMVNVVALFL